VVTVCVAPAAAAELVRTLRFEFLASAVLALLLLVRETAPLDAARVVVAAAAATAAAAALFAAVDAALVALAARGRAAGGGVVRGHGVF
jgi:hypothetical protein